MRILGFDATLKSNVLKIGCATLTRTRVRSLLNKAKKNPSLCLLCAASNEECILPYLSEFTINKVCSKTLTKLKRWSRGGKR